MVHLRVTGRLPARNSVHTCLRWGRHSPTSYMSYSSITLEWQFPKGLLQHEYLRLNVRVDVRSSYTPTVLTHLFSDRPYRGLGNACIGSDSRLQKSAMYLCRKDYHQDGSCQSCSALTSWVKHSMVKFCMFIKGERGTIFSFDKSLPYPIGHQKVKPRPISAIIVKIQTQHTLLQINFWCCGHSVRKRKP